MCSKAVERTTDIVMAIVVRSWSNLNFDKIFCNKVATCVRAAGIKMPKRGKVRTQPGQRARDSAPLTCAACLRLRRPSARPLPASFQDLLQAAFHCAPAPPPPAASAQTPGYMRDVAVMIRDKASSVRNKTRLKGITDHRDEVVTSSQLQVRIRAPEG